MRASYLCIRSGASRESPQRRASLSAARCYGSVPVNTFPCVCDRRPAGAVGYHGPVLRNRARLSPEWTGESRRSRTRSALRAGGLSARSFRSSPASPALTRSQSHPRTRPARPRCAFLARARASCARPVLKNSSRPFA